MAKFQSPPELAPGVSRPTGFYKPGQVFDWPDSNTEACKAKGIDERPSKKWLPVDKEALALLKKAWPDGKFSLAAAPATQDAGVAKPETVKEVSERLDPHEATQAKGKKRASDR